MLARSNSVAGAGSSVEHSLRPPALVLMLGLFSASCPAMAQSSVDVLRGLLRDQQIGRSFQALSNFGGAPGLGAANYSAGNLEISSYKLPIAHTFSPIAGNGVGQISPYVETTLSYLNARADNAFTIDNGTGIPSQSRTDFNLYAGLAGAGLEVRVAENISVRPIVLAGYSRIESNTRFSGPAAPSLEVLTGGVLSRIRIDNAVVGGALEGVYRRTFSSDLRVAGNLRYNHFYGSAYAASDASFKGNGNFGIMTARIELNGPTRFQLLGRDLRWIAFTGGTILTGQQHGSLGFSEYVEFGGGIELVDPTVIRGVEGIVLRGSGLLGNGVSGWSAGLSLAF